MRAPRCLVPVFAVALLVAASAAPAGEANSAAFDLPEVPVYSLDQGHQFAGGEWAECGPKPDPGVKAYPPLESKKPLYAALTLGRGLPGLKEGLCLQCVVDESGGTGQGYDRLYVDLDRDGNLAKESPVAVAPKPSEQIHDPQDARQTWFEVIHVPWDYGGDIGKRPLALRPRLVQLRQGSTFLTLSLSKVHAGRIMIGNRPYRAVVSGRHGISVRYDVPGAGLMLDALDAAGQAPFALWWWGSDRMNQMRNVDGKWYSFAATPLGDKLFVKEYTGDLGVLRVDKGRRDMSGPPAM